MLPWCCCPCPQVSPYIVTAKRIAEEQSQQLAGSITQQLQLPGRRALPAGGRNPLQQQAGSQWAGLSVAAYGATQQPAYAAPQQQQYSTYVLTGPSGNHSNSSSNASMATTVQYACPLVEPGAQE